jgi:phosphatidate cytidylyltransferase
MNQKNLLKRILVAVFGIPILFIASLIGKWPFLIIFDIIIATACWEFYCLTERAGHRPQKFLGIMAVLLISLDMYFHQGQHVGWIFLAAVIVSMLNELFKKKNNHFINSSITIFGIAYLSLFAFFLFIRNMDIDFIQSYTDKGRLIIYILGLIWICDSSAYFIGHQFGKHSLCPRISPNKTWEGSAGGFVFTVASAVGIKYFLAPFLTLGDSFIMGILIGTAGQFSDLIESLIKRNIGTKDTSQLLPGHGGFLDRFDSSMLVAPILAIYLLMRSL